MWKKGSEQKQSSGFLTPDSRVYYAPPSSSFYSKELGDRLTKYTHANDGVKGVHTRSYRKIIY